MKAELLRTWRQAAEEPFAGWDFSHLKGRMITDRPPWSFIERAGELMRQGGSVIDMDTGGGERLLSLKSHWPKRVVATEAYPPNFDLAVKRLTPHGAEVVSLRLGDELQMPFADNEFDLVLNRHGAFNPAEVARILAAGGTFYTEQVHGLWAHDLLAVFNVQASDSGATPAYYASKLTGAGVVLVDVQEWESELRFTDVAAIVYYLKAIPWLVPNFGVDTHQSALFELQGRLETGSELVFEAREYVIEASKPQA